MTVTRLNLSSDPFRNRALPWTVAIAVTIVSFLFLVFIAKWTIQIKAQAQTTEHEVAELRKQTDALTQKTAQIKIALTPDEQRTLKSAHTLVDRKRFSWARLFEDLEAALPGTVRVQRIAVKGVATEVDRTVADLELTVVSKNPATVTQLIQDMDREGIFHAELVSQNPKTGKGEPGAEYEMNVHYVPRSGASVPAGSNRPVDTASQNPKER
jgi:Tfp pilus assembly protein PilN